MIGLSLRLPSLAVSGAVTAPNVLNVFIVAGQSNMDGRCTDNSEDWITDGEVDDLLVFSGSDVIPFDTDAPGRRGNGSSWIGGLARSVLTSNNTNVSDGEVVVIGETTYRFKSTLAQAYDVKIGADADATLANLVHAINGTGVVGTNYYAGTEAHPDVDAYAVKGHAFTICAKVSGAGGNSIATTTTSATLSFNAPGGGATDETLLGGGTPDSAGKFSFGEYGLSLLGGVLDNVVECRVTNGSISLYDYGAACWAVPGTGAGRIYLLELLKAKYEALVAWAAENDYSVNLRGLIWHQGETDAAVGGDAITNYADNLDATFTWIRENIADDENMPIWLGTTGTDSTSYNATIEAAHLAIADGETIFCRDNVDATYSDGVHFDGTFSKTFGEWLYDTISAYLAGGVAPDAPILEDETSVTSSGFTANWRPVIGATSYRLDVSTANDFGSFVTGYEDLEVEGETQAVSGLSALTTYYWRVRAVNANGTSGNSATASQQTLTDVYEFTNEEAEAYVEAMSSEPTDAVKEIIDDLVSSLKAANVGGSPVDLFAKLDRLYLFNLHHDTAADTLINVIDPSVIATLHDSDGSTNPSWETEKGFTTDATNYIDVKFQPSTAFGSGAYQAKTQGSGGMAMGMVLHTDPGDSNSAVCGAYTSAGSLYCALYASLASANAGKPGCRMFNDTQFIAGTLIDTSAPKNRYYMMSRVPADTDKITIGTEGGTELSASLAEEASVTNNSVFIGGMNQGGTFGAGVATYPAIWWVGSAITAAQWAVMQTILATYMSAMAALS